MSFRSVGGVMSSMAQARFGETTSASQSDIRGVWMDICWSLLDWNDRVIGLKLLHLQKTNSAENVRAISRGRGPRDPTAEVGPPRARQPTWPGASSYFSMP